MVVLMLLLMVVLMVVLMLLPLLLRGTAALALLNMLSFLELLKHNKERKVEFGDDDGGDDAIDGGDNHDQDVRKKTQ